MPRCPGLIASLEERGSLVASIAEVAMRAEAGDASCSRCLPETGDLIGRALAGSVNALNPSHLVLGGNLAVVAPWMLTALRNALARAAMEQLAARLNIELSPLGADAVLMGGVALALQKVDADLMQGRAARSRRDRLPLGGERRALLEPHRTAVAAALRAGDVAVLDALDDLRRAEFEQRALPQPMAARGKPALRLRRHRSLDPDVVALDPPARRIDRRLRVLADASMRLTTCVWPCGCIVPPMTPKMMTGSPSLVTKPGMMVLSGRFDGPTRFGWPGVGDEAGAAIVERDARARHDHAGAEAVIVRLDERDHHAVLVRRREIDGRAAMHRTRRRHRDAVAPDRLAPTRRAAPGRGARPGRSS